MNRLAYRWAIAPLALALGGLPWACGSSEDTPDPGADSGDASADAHAEAQQPPSTADAGHEGGLTVVEAGPEPAATFCGMPGSLVFTDSGTTRVSGGPSNDLTWLTLPSGYCAHYFGNVGNARQLRFSPTGDLFVASPTQGTTGGGASGLAAIVVLPDDGHDGVADGVTTFLGGLPATQGLLFASDGSFYFQATNPANTEGQVGTLIRKIPYTSGQRTADGSTATTVATIEMYYSGTHWPKTLDQADDGTIYVGNGGDQDETCDPSVFPRPFHGGILKLDSTQPNGVSEVAMGFRNPIDIKCQRGHDHCFSTELSLDYSGADDGREKLITIHQGDDWGYPCCATASTPYGTVTGNPNCSQVQADTNSFIIGDTPFGFDFMPASWTGPYSGRVVVALHGVFGTWVGARVVAIALDPTTGLPQPASDLGSGTPATLANFLTGFDDNKHDHGRPSDVTFGPDGRMYISDDDDGDIIWVAPVDLPNPYASFSSGTDGGGDGGGG